ncbi:MAG: tripartite tricarboxylate transporter substrate binding protein [Reyranella sp.]|uniref:Bug family tripartite tricarboxylate transporter substrate binding protein n=1 Tax=Reyranella sp. TaxID=1929291 RepID=UPI001227AC4B|nr:tripartite tricarboxylate transporter substrate binding protein [Reyranella sp.]TAJ38436.1 MAG: tripartite tricarboxylate transporter substrate binding protein [Reyranella sp.]
MTNINRRRFAALLPAAATVAATPFPSHAQDPFPVRPIRLIVPWPPGGGVDTFARVIQGPLGSQLGQTVVIDNIGGGSGRVGTQTASRAQPDGYTFLLANDTFAATEALPVAGAATLRSAFTPVTLAISGPQGVFTHPRSGFVTIEDFVAAAKARPGVLNVGVPGLASSQHLTSELLLRAAGNVSVTHVPYRGGGPLLQDLIAGNIDAGVVTFAAGAQQAASGQLVALAVTSPARSPGFPKVPAAAEAVAPGFAQTTWMGLFAPKGTPEAAQLLFHTAVLAVLGDSKVIDRLTTLGFEPAGLDRTRFVQLFDQTIATFANIAAEKGIAGAS